MRVEKSSRIGLQAILIATLFGSATIASAQYPEPVQRAARLFGVCWGDGYHACRCSGIRLCADLPPRSYAARSGAPHHPAHCVHQHGSTFYDRFDAANGRCCDAGGACGGPECCDAVSCCDATPGCDSPPDIAAKADSLDVWRSQARIAPRLEAPDPTAATASISDLDSAALTKAVSEPITKKYPIRPEPPTSVTPRSITVAGTYRPSAKSDGSMRLNFSPSVPIDPVSNQPLRSGTVASQTPRRILPAHPHDSSAADSLAARKISIQPEVSVPQPGIQMPPTTPASVPLVSAVPSYAGEIDDVPPLSHPRRLGMQTAEAAKSEMNTPAPTIVLRPKRLGGTAPLKPTPVAARPRVEVAERGAQSDDQLIRQPDGTTVKRR